MNLMDFKKAASNKDHLSDELLYKTLCKTEFLKVRSVLFNACKYIIIASCNAIGVYNIKEPYTVKRVIIS